MVRAGKHVFPAPLGSNGVPSAIAMPEHRGAPLFEPSNNRETHHVATNMIVFDSSNKQEAGKTSFGQLQIIE